MNTEKSPGRVIMVLPKSPIPTGDRIGNPNNQDWYRTIEMAVAIRTDPDKILIVTAFSTHREGCEAEHYVNTLELEFDVEPDHIIVIKDGLETIAQLALADQYARKSGQDLVIICTPMHSLRVKYLCWKDEIRARVLVAKFGWPRPREAVTDLILAVIFPIVDLIGQRDWFLKKVCARRTSGKL